MKFGFRKAKSIVDAILVVNRAKLAIQGKESDKIYCAIVLIDIKNAFNSAPKNFKSRISHRDSKKLFFSLNSIRVDLQGSVLDPLL